MPSPWAENIRRVLGFHDLAKGEAAKLLEVSPQAISEWQSKTRKEGNRQPNVSTLLRVAEFFELEAGKLAGEDFVTLLPGLADEERFKRVEKKITRSRSKLSAVPSRVEKSTRS